MSKATSAAGKPSLSTDFGTVLAAVAATPGAGPASGGSQAIAKTAAKLGSRPDAGIHSQAGAGQARDDGDPVATSPLATAAAAATSNPLPVTPLPLPVAAVTEAATLLCRGQVALPGTAAPALTAQSLPDGGAVPGGLQATAKESVGPPDSESANFGLTTVSEISQVAKPTPNPMAVASFFGAADSPSADASQFVPSETQILLPEVSGLITEAIAAHPVQSSISPNPNAAAVGKDRVVNAAEVPGAPQTVPELAGPQALLPPSPSLSKAPALTPAAVVAILPASSGQMPAAKSAGSQVPPPGQAIRLKQPSAVEWNSSTAADQIPALIYGAPDSSAAEAIAPEARASAPSQAVSVPETTPTGGMSGPCSIPAPIAAASPSEATSEQKPAPATERRVATPEPAASAGKKSSTAVPADTIPPQVETPATVGIDSAAAVAAPGRAGQAPAAPSQAAQPPELPKTHQMLDSAPAAAPVAPPTRFASGPGGEVQMHVGVRTTAFGTVEIHTVVQQNQVGIAVHGERGLAHWFSSELASLESGLKDHRLNLTAVDFDNGRSGVQTATSFHQGHPRRDFSETTSSCAISVEDQDTAGEFETVEVLPPDLGIRSAGTRVSIRV